MNKEKHQLQTELYKCQQLIEEQSKVIQQLITKTKTMKKAGDLQVWKRFSFGGLGNIDGLFNCPYGVVDEKTNNFIVADYSDHRIQVFDSNGRSLFTFGSDRQLNYPIGVVIGSNARIFVLENGNHQISVFTSEGRFLGRFGGYGSKEGQLNSPYSITRDCKTGTIVVADYYNYRVQEFSENGDFIRKFGEDIFNFRCVLAVVVDQSSGNIITSTEDGEVQVFDGDRRYLSKFSTAIDRPLVLVDLQSNIIVVSQGAGNGLTKVFDSQGVFLHEFDLGVSEIRGVAMDGKGRLVVTEVNSHKVHVLSTFFELPFSPSFPSPVLLLEQS